MVQLKPEIQAPELQPPPPPPPPPPPLPPPPSPPPAPSPSQSDQNSCVDSRVKDADGTKEVNRSCFILLKHCHLCCVYVGIVNCVMI